MSLQEIALFAFFAYASCIACESIVEHQESMNTAIVQETLKGKYDE